MHFKCHFLSYSNSVVILKSLLLSAEHELLKKKKKKNCPDFATKVIVQNGLNRKVTNLTPDQHGAKDDL